MIYIYIIIYIYNILIDIYNIIIYTSTITWVSQNRTMPQNCNVQFQYKYSLVGGFNVLNVQGYETG